MFKNANYSTKASKKKAHAVKWQFSEDMLSLEGYTFYDNFAEGKGKWESLPGHRFLEEIPPQMQEYLINPYNKIKKVYW